MLMAHGGSPAAACPMPPCSRLCVHVLLLLHTNYCTQLCPCDTTTTLTSMAHRGCTFQPLHHTLHT